MEPRLHPLFDPDVLAGALTLRAQEEEIRWQRLVEGEFQVIEEQLRAQGELLERQGELIKRLIGIIAGGES